MDNANKTSHIDIVQSPDVNAFLENCFYMKEPTGEEISDILSYFKKIEIEELIDLPDNIITIDSSSYESQIRDDIPFTNIGYVKLVNFLLKLNDLGTMRNSKFVDPFEVSKLADNKESINFVLPGSNVKYKDAESIKVGFRLALDEYFDKLRENENDSNTSLKTTLFWISSYRENGSKDKIFLHECPNGCGNKNLGVLNIDEAQYCPNCGKRIFATDTLRFYEEFDESSPSNQAVYGRFAKAIRHIQLAHLLRMLMINHKNTYLSILNKLSFIINGPLAIAGTAAWVHNSLMKIINEINKQLNSKGMSDLLIIGLINNGLAVYDYAHLINKHIEINSLLCVSDEFRDKYINYNREASSTTFGAETYYGQDFIWKNSSGNILVFDLPYFVGEKSKINNFKFEKSDYSKYNNLLRVLSILQDLKSDMDVTSVVPLVLSKQYSQISMEPGAKVLDILSKVNFT